MNVVLIYTYFNKMDLISLLYPDTNLLQSTFNRFREYFSTVFGWTNQMVQ